jgi:hypothetical protein
MPTHINPTKEYKRFNGRILLQLTIVDTFLCAFCFLTGLPYVSFYKPHEFHQFHPYEILQQRWWASSGAHDFCIIAVYYRYTILLYIYVCILDLDISTLDLDISSIWFNMMLCPYLHDICITFTSCPRFFSTLSWFYGYSTLIYIYR